MKFFAVTAVHVKEASLPPHHVMSDRDSDFDTSDDDASFGFGPTAWHFNTNEDALSMLRESALRSELCTALGIESRFTADDERRLESASYDEILVLGTEGGERRCEINEIESGPFLGTFGLFIAAARDGAMVEYIGLDEEIVYRTDHHTELFSASAALLLSVAAYEWIVAAPPAALHDDDPEIGPSKPFVVFDFDQTLASLNSGRSAVRTNSTRKQRRQRRYSSSTRVASAAPCALRGSAAF